MAYRVEAAFLHDYVSFDRIRAAKITTVGPECKNVWIKPDNRQVKVPGGSRRPEVGWYVIFYADGHITFMPPEDFKRSYTKVGKVFGS